MGHFLNNDPQTNSKRADHKIYWAYVSEHFKTKKKLYKKFFFSKTVKIIFKKKLGNFSREKCRLGQDQNMLKKFSKTICQKNNNSNLFELFIWIELFI